MRSEEFDAGSGSRLHPNVRDYVTDAPGGIGSDQGSVVGMVPTHMLAPYAHHQGDVSPDSAHTVRSIANDIATGRGIEEPLVLEYDHRSGWAYIGEGNHRLAAAQMAGAPEVPVRVERTRRAAQVRDLEGAGAPAAHHSIPGHVPAALHPNYLRLGESHEAADVHTEIADLLRPAGRWR